MPKSHNKIQIQNSAKISCAVTVEKYAEKIAHCCDRDFNPCLPVGFSTVTPYKAFM